MFWGSGTGWFWPLLMGAFWIAVIICAVFVVRWLMSPGTDRGRDAAVRSIDPALQILRERYAKGEIDREEFEEMKRTLE